MHPQLLLRKSSRKILRSVFSRTDFSRYLFLSRRTSSRILSPDSFSRFLWEEVLRKILQEKGENTTKISGNFLQMGPVQKIWEEICTQILIWMASSGLPVLVLFPRYVDKKLAVEIIDRDYDGKIHLNASHLAKFAKTYREILKFRCLKLFQDIATLPDLRQEKKSQRAPNPPGFCAA